MPDFLDEPLVLGGAKSQMFFPLRSGCLGDINHLQFHESFLKYVSTLGLFSSWFWRQCNLSLLLSHPDVLPEFWMMVMYTELGEPIGPVCAELHSDEFTPATGLQQAPANCRPSSSREIFKIAPGREETPGDKEKQEKHLTSSKRHKLQWR